MLTPVLQQIISSSDFTHVVSSHSSTSKDILPRLSAILDVTAISDVTSVSHSESDGSTTFTRPIYAGNAIATVKAPGGHRPTIFTVRGTAFAKADSSNSAEVDVKAVDPVQVKDPLTQHIRSTITQSDRPELASASRVVSGGRALKNAETFNKTLEPLADVLGAAIGASRAAVDAGYADNSLQVSKGIILANAKCLLNSG
jgi:electron transfer flavoprotein alpha subunit